MLIVLPFCNKDGVIAAKNVAWMYELDGKTEFECMIAWPTSVLPNQQDTKPEYVDMMRANASKVFARVHEFSYPDSTENTWPAGANWAWQSVARWIPMITNYPKNPYPFEKVIAEKTPWLFLEPDAVPVKPGWMKILYDEYCKAGQPFMGHIVRDMGHMNGVAVYPNDVQQFCRDALQCVHQAWDVVLREETITLTHNANHLIQHCWGLAPNDHPQHRGDDPVASFRDVGQVNRVLSKPREEWEQTGKVGPMPDPVIFHRTKDGSLIDCLMQTRQPVADSFRELRELISVIKEKEEVCREASPASVEAVQSVTTGTPGPISIPSTEIFIVTYHKDAEWLRYCLRSIKKFAKHFTGVTVVFPDRDVEIIEPVCQGIGFDCLQLKLEMFTEAEGKGMLHHMAIECMADEFVYGSGANYILHMDSDCIFVEPVTPLDYFVDGKPVLLCEEYSRFAQKYPTILEWKRTSERALGIPCTHETMRRHPAVHHKDLYRQVRHQIEKVHDCPFIDYVLSCKPDFPQGFSEFNVLGAWALAKCPELYHWIDCAKDVRPREKIWQGWSHGGLDRKSDSGMFVPMTPREVFAKVLGKI